MATRVEIHMHAHDPSPRVAWYSNRQHQAGNYGVIDLGETLLFVDEESLERLAAAVAAMLRERDDAEGRK